MAISSDLPASVGAELSGLREENRSLYGVIRLVSSSLEMLPMLQGVVDLGSLELAMSEDDDAYPGGFCHIKVALILGVVFRVPVDLGEALITTCLTFEDGEFFGGDVIQKFLFEAV